LTKDPKTCSGENKVSSANGAGKTGYPHVEDKLHPCLLPCTNIKWQIKNLNVRPKTTARKSRKDIGTYRHKQ
jgi:hypothetical protein